MTPGDNTILGLANVIPLLLSTLNIYLPVTKVHLKVMFSTAWTTSRKHKASSTTYFVLHLKTGHRYLRMRMHNVQLCESCL